MGRKLPIVIFYYLRSDWKPINIIKKGYSKKTVYRYNSLWKKAKEQFLKETGGV